MRVPILLMMGTLAGLLLGAATMNGTTSSLRPTQPLHLAVAAAQDEMVCEELPWEPIEGRFDVADVPEFEVSWVQMVREIVMLYEYFFDEIGPNDPRRGNFELFAEHVADAVITYQNQETDIGGRLPRHKNTHLMVATIITKEASVNEKVEGKRGEIGLMQIMPHGPTIAHLDPEFVKKRPKLQILLGTRWLARQVKTCYPEGIEDHEWTDEHWIGPLSAYAAGPGGVSKRTGKCHKFKKSKERVAKLQLYRVWIDGDTYARTQN